MNFFLTTSKITKNNKINMIPYNENSGPVVSEGCEYNISEVSTEDTNS